MAAPNCEIVVPEVSTVSQLFFQSYSFQIVPAMAHLLHSLKVVLLTSPIQHVVVDCRVCAEHRGSEPLFTCCGKTTFPWRKITARAWNACLNYDLFLACLLRSCPSASAIFLGLPQGIGSIGLGGNVISVIISAPQSLVPQCPRPCAYRRQPRYAGSRRWTRTRTVTSLYTCPLFLWLHGVHPVQTLNLQSLGLFRWGQSKWSHDHHF